MSTRLVNVEQSRALEHWAIEALGMPPELLMENAGSAVVSAMERHFEGLAGKSVTVLCGKGSNGGDGLVAARHLAALGTRVKVALAFPEAELSTEASRQLKRCQALKIPVQHLSTDPELQAGQASLRSSDILVDALLGTGSRGAVTGFLAKLLIFANGLGLPMVAVDLPSGLDADSGRVEGACAYASLTVTFACAKVGLLLYPGASYCGKVVVADLGFPAGFKELEGPRCFINEGLGPWVPRRPVQAHKKSVGTVLVLAGSLRYGGAPLLTARGAMRSGAGMVHLAVPQGLLASLTGRIPELILHGIGKPGSQAFAESDLPAVEALAKDCHALVVGPGLGQEASTGDFCRALWHDNPLPAVFDADALNLLAAAPFQGAAGPRVLTPHAGEMARLAGIPSDRVEAERLRVAGSASARTGAVIVLKGPHSLIAAPGGESWVNLTGNPGLATAGTGDVLAGALAGLLAQGLPPAEAARLAVHAHGLAGDELSTGSELGLAASDLAERLPAALAKIAQGA
jgi:NAD(P)H-hydrate epimerase